MWRCAMLREEYSSGQAAFHIQTTHSGLSYDFSLESAGWLTAELNIPEQLLHGQRIV